MCGILALVRLRMTQATDTSAIVEATQIVRHRGPDDEGYLLWCPGEPPRLYAGSETSERSRAWHGLEMLPRTGSWHVALGHRRLAIIDLSPGGYQPMVHAATGLAIVFNGEIYNHVELRLELSRLGHRFRSQSDTEVLLTAWIEWGTGALDRLNGMFAFVLLDPREGVVYAVRDRFGIKPLYWTHVGDMVAFASEVKQLRRLPGFDQAIDVSAAREYLASGQIDHDTRTLDAGVHQVLGGERAIIRLDAAVPRLVCERWYTLSPRPFKGSVADAAMEVRTLLEDSVRLRLRADVPVGSCLSGGLDSSAIVCLVHRELATQSEHLGQVTITARFADSQFDEWFFASQVVAATRCRSIVVWPTIEQLLVDFDRHLWSMDFPCTSTSPFSQWCVFAAAATGGLRVMLDGQGSDEQLAGYTGNETALYTGLMARGAGVRLVREVLGYRQRQGHVPIGQLLAALRVAAPTVDSILPARLRPAAESQSWLRGEAIEPTRSPRSLNDRLADQLLSTSLPVLLRYEDRNSMAHSIETRVPFLDVRLVELLASLPDTMKLRNGVTKVVLRHALADVLPPDILHRRDKMGFVTPEQRWLTGVADSWVSEAVSLAADSLPELIDSDAALRFADDMLNHRIPFSFALWRLACFGRWMATRSGPTGPHTIAAAAHAG